MNQKEIEAYYKEAVTGHRPTSKWDLRADLNSIWQWHKQVNFLGRKSPNSIYSESIATFEDDRASYNQKDAEGFIRLNALRLRLGKK